MRGAVLGGVLTFDRPGTPETHVTGTTFSKLVCPENTLFTSDLLAPKGRVSVVYTLGRLTWKTIKEKLLQGFISCTSEVQEPSRILREKSIYF